MNHQIIRHPVARFLVAAGKLALPTPFNSSPRYGTVQGGTWTIQ
jgi:hypothetical protein